MSDIIPNVVVSMPSQLFTLARKFQAASNGKIFIGKIDTDPTLPENQIQVYLENEDGSHIPVSQPLIINQAGFPVYNGQIAKFVTVEGHSMAVYDSYGAQQFYYPNVLKYDPDQFEIRFRDELSSNTGASLVGTNSGGTVQDEINRIGNDLSIKSIHSMPIKFLNYYKDILHENVFPQGLAEDDDYWYITEDVSLAGEEYSIVVSRIDKLTLDKYSIAEKIKCHGQGIGVLGDGIIFVGGSSNSLITIIDFNKNSTQEKNCIGFYKDFPFCFDKNKNLIYQLQDDSAVGAKLTRISILSLDYGFISSMSLDREIMTTGYPQGITTDGNTLYINSGGSWSSSSSGVWNNKWSLFRLTTDGVILNRVIYTRDSMGGIISRGKPAIIHEPQGIYFHNGKLSFLQYIGNSDGTYASIFSEDDNGEQVKAINKNRFITYSGLGDIGVNERGLESGKTILNIIDSMQDNSSISFSLNNIASFSHDTGINFGTCVAYRVTKNRAFAISTEQSSAKNPRGKISIVHVYGDDNWQSPPIIISGEIESSLLYSSSSVISPKLIPIPDIKNYHSIVINLTNDQPSNPKTKIKFSSEEINYNIKNGLSFRLDCASSWITFSINTNGVLVHSASGNAYVTSIIGM
ncbi:phage head-binding domain-containing protein [Proteus terrae]|uniref:phage head-binding domain-containing protein n=1 Tax=Proteus terrae TaxID=1574161 RepID=UPI0032DB59BE